MKEAGYVYILTNPSFKEDWVKIGKSSRPVDIRSKELDNTAVPLPFEIYAALKRLEKGVMGMYYTDAIFRSTYSFSIIPIPAKKQLDPLEPSCKIKLSSN